MNRFGRLLAALGCAAVILPAMATGATAATTAAKNSAEPLVIGHRGASGYRPEHPITAYGVFSDYPDTTVDARDGAID